jgi:hypothetical protein
MPEFIPVKRYSLTWNDTDAPYGDPVTHKIGDSLDLGEAMQIALREPATVTDNRTGEIVWVGSQTTRHLSVPR